MQIVQLNKKVSVRFRRWTRKAYAVFASLNKLITIGRLKIEIAGKSLFRSFANSSQELPEERDESRESPSPADTSTATDPFVTEIVAAPLSACVETEDSLRDNILKICSFLYSFKGCFKKQILGTACRSVSEGFKCKMLKTKLKQCGSWAFPIHFFFVVGVKRTATDGINDYIPVYDQMDLSNEICVLPESKTAYSENKLSEIQTLIYKIKKDSFNRLYTLVYD